MFYYRGIKFIGWQFSKRSGWFRIFFVGLYYVRLNDWEIELSDGEIKNRHSFRFRMGRYLIDYLTADFEKTL